MSRYLDTGEHDDPLFGAWPGQNVFESATNGTNSLLESLLNEVESRIAGVRLPEVQLPADLVAFTRSRVESMVHGLFPSKEQDTVLGVLERSVIFVTPANYRDVLHRVELDTAWALAKFLLASVGARPLGKNPQSIVGLDEETTSYVSTDASAQPTWVCLPMLAAAPGSESVVSSCPSVARIARGQRVAVARGPSNATAQLVLLC